MLLLTLSCRAFNEEADVDYINKRNAHFNKKVPNHAKRCSILRSCVCRLIATLVSTPKRSKLILREGPHFKDFARAFELLLCVVLTTLHVYTPAVDMTVPTKMSQKVVDMMLSALPFFTCL